MAVECHSGLYLYILMSLLVLPPSMSPILVASQSQFELPVDSGESSSFAGKTGQPCDHVIHACAHYITHTHTLFADGLPCSTFIHVKVYQCLSSHTVFLDKHMRHPPKIDGLVSLLLRMTDIYGCQGRHGQDTAASSAGVNCGICARPQRIRRTWDRCWEGLGANRAG